MSPLSKNDKNQLSAAVRQSENGLDSEMREMEQYDQTFQKMANLNLQQNDSPSFGNMNIASKNMDKSAPVIKETVFVDKTYFANSMHRLDDDEDSDMEAD